MQAMSNANRDWKLRCKGLSDLEKRIQEAFSDQILQVAAKRYGLLASDVRKLGGFESFVFEYEKDNCSYILRISHCTHRTAEQVQGEVHWLNDLAGNGVSVSRAIVSENGRPVEVIHANDGYFTAVSFEKAKGRPPGKADWNVKLFRQMGSMTGKMHALTRRYQPGDERFRRPEWHEDLDDFASKFLDPSEPEIVEKFRAIRQYPLRFSKDKEAYGLIHVDFHRGNFFVKDGRITLFDFDDCQYSWFAEDIAMALFYAISPDCWKEEDVAFAKHFYDSFMDGYSSENTIDRKWLQEIPYFLKQREINVYLALKASVSGDDEFQGWSKAFMKDRRYKIENDVPYVELAF